MNKNQLKLIAAAYAAGYEKGFSDAREQRTASTEHEGEIARLLTKIDPVARLENQIASGTFNYEGSGKQKYEKYRETTDNPVSYVTFLKRLNSPRVNKPLTTQISYKTQYVNDIKEGKYDAAIFAVIDQVYINGLKISMNRPIGQKDLLNYISSPIDAISMSYFNQLAKERVAQMDSLFKAKILVDMNVWLTSQDSHSRAATSRKIERVVKSTGIEIEQINELIQERRAVDQDQQIKEFILKHKDTIRTDPIMFWMDLMQAGIYVDPFNINTRIDRLGVNFER